jgi:ankyrin repeat protein
MDEGFDFIENILDERVTWSDLQQHLSQNQEFDQLHHSFSKNRTGSFIDKQGEEYLAETMDAIEKNDLNEIKRLVKKNVNLNTGDYDKRTPLHIAVSKNYKDMVMQLLKTKDIKVNPIDKFEMTPLMEAKKNNFQEIVDLLKANGGVTINSEIGYEMCSIGAEGNLKALVTKDFEDMCVAD